MCDSRRPEHGADSLTYIDRRLADVEADLDDEETMQSLGLHGRVRLHERRAVLQDIRQQLQDAR